jgi:hypothetical protein
MMFCFDSLYPASLNCNNTIFRYALRQLCEQVFQTSYAVHLWFPNKFCHSGFCITEQGFKIPVTYISNNYFHLLLNRFSYMLQYYGMITG